MHHGAKHEPVGHRRGGKHLALPQTRVRRAQTPFRIVWSSVLEVAWDPLNALKCPKPSGVRLLHGRLVALSSVDEAAMCLYYFVALLVEEVDSMYLLSTLEAM